MLQHGHCNNKNIVSEFAFSQVSIRLREKFTMNYTMLNTNEGSRNMKTLIEAEVNFEAA